MSWPLVNISELAKVASGFAFKSKDFAESGNPIVRISNIKDGAVDLTNAALIPSENIGKGLAYTVESGDVLMAMSGATTGKVGVFYSDKPGPVYLNQRVGKFVFDSKLVDKEYLWFYLKSPRCQDQINLLAEGAAQPNISGSQLESIKIPLPPLETQNQIAAVLEKADQLRKDCQQMEIELNSLAQSVFIDMFGDPVTNPKGWEVNTLDEVSKVQIGPFGTQLHKHDYVSNGVPLINPTHIKSGKIIPNYDLTVSESKYRTLVQYHLKTGDIVMGRRGEMGRTAVIDSESNGWFCGTGSLFIRPIPSKVMSVYLNSVLSGAAMKLWLEEQSLGATMPNLNKKILHSIKVPIPPIAEQENYVRGLSLLADQKQQITAQFYDTNDFFNSLMQKAFKGELNLK